MNRDEVVEPLHCEDEWQPTSAVIQSVPTTNLYRQPISADTQSVSSTNLYRQPICADTQSVPRTNLYREPICTEKQSVPRTDLCRQMICPVIQCLSRSMTTRRWRMQWTPISAHTKSPEPLNRPLHSTSAVIPSLPSSNPCRHPIRAVIRSLFRSTRSMITSRWRMQSILLIWDLSRSPLTI